MWAISLTTSKCQLHAPLPCTMCPELLTLTNPRSHQASLELSNCAESLDGCQSLFCEQKRSVCGMLHL